MRETIDYAEDDTKDKSKTGRLTAVDQAIVLGLCVDVKNSYAMEILTAEEMMAYVDRVMQHPQNWTIYSMALLLKSRLEFERSKTKERAVLQMQVLVDQQSDRLTPLQSRVRDVEDSAPANERLQWLYAVAWVPIWKLKKQLGERYMELGVAGNAYTIFEDLQMWEQAVDCLIIMDRRAKAEEMVREQLKERPTPNLYCVLGNLLDSPEWWIKAWEVSNGRYARARLLGKWAFRQGDIRACADHLKLALAINTLHPGVVSPRHVRPSS